MGAFHASVRVTVKKPIPESTHEFEERRDSYRGSIAGSARGSVKASARGS